MESTEKDDKTILEVKNDGGFLTGPILVGGTKLAYEVGKDLVSWLKPEKKLFIQLLDSCYRDNKHVITARLANAYVHSIHVECINFSNESSIEVKRSVVEFGMSGTIKDAPNVCFPFLLLPNGVLDIDITLPEQTDSKIKKQKGLNVVCIFSPVDKLGDSEMFSAPARLRWD